jgi:hypothetical protein
MCQRGIEAGLESWLSLEAAARTLLAGHIQFRGRVDRFHFEASGDALIVSGRVPSFYLKQLVQTVLSELDHVSRIDNRVAVVCVHGVSSCSEVTRQRCALEYRRLGKVPECLPTCAGTPGS